MSACSSTTTTGKNGNAERLLILPNAQAPAPASPKGFSTPATQMRLTAIRPGKHSGKNRQEFRQYPAIIHRIAPLCNNAPSQIIKNQNRGKNGNATCLLVCIYVAPAAVRLPKKSGDMDPTSLRQDFRQKIGKSSGNISDHCVLGHAAATPNIPGVSQASTRTK